MELTAPTTRLTEQKACSERLPRQKVMTLSCDSLLGSSRLRAMRMLSDRSCERRLFSSSNSAASRHTLAS